MSQEGSHLYTWLVKPIDTARLRHHARRKATHSRKLQEVKRKLEPYKHLSSLERRGRLINDPYFANLLRGKRDHTTEETRHDEKCERIKDRMERLTYVSPEARSDAAAAQPFLPSSV